MQTKAKEKTHQSRYFLPTHPLDLELCCGTHTDIMFQLGQQVKLLSFSAWHFCRNTGPHLGQSTPHELFLNLDTQYSTHLQDTPIQHACPWSPWASSLQVDTCLCHTHPLNTALCVVYALGIKGRLNAQVLQEVGGQTPNDIMYRKLIYKAGKKITKFRQTLQETMVLFLSCTQNRSGNLRYRKSTGGACMGKAQGNLKRKLVTLQYRDSENTQMHVPH